MTLRHLVAVAVIPACVATDGQWQGSARVPGATAGKVCATQDRCPHGNASLAEGWVEDGTVECPLHQGVFDIASGKHQCPPVTTDLRCYDVRVEDGTVFLRAEAA